MKTAKTIKFEADWITYEGNVYDQSYQKYLAKNRKPSKIGRK